MSGIGSGRSIEEVTTGVYANGGSVARPPLRASGSGVDVAVGVGVGVDVAVGVDDGGGVDVHVGGGASS
jgi:hypothetical protein